MTISVRQYEHLQEMGISVWRAKDPDPIKKNENLPTTLPKYNELIEDPLFLDILLALDISIGEISISESSLNMGIFNWKFIDSDNIKFENNVLFTPSLSRVKDSPSLKRAMWSTMCSNTI